VFHSNKFNARLVLILGAVLLSMEPGASAAEPQRILCVGDSITAAKKGWVAKLGANASVETFNGGRSGHRAADAKGRYTAAMDAAKKKNFKADKVFLFLGVNDLPARDKRPGDVKVGICVQGVDEAILLALKQFKPEDIVLIAPCDVNAQKMSKTNLRKGYDKAKPLLAKLEAEYKKLAEKHGIQFHSLLKVVSQENFTDGLHPSDAGHEQIAKSVLEFLSGEKKTSPKK
jgi:lysophospholipase L1-like esterase